MANRKTNPRRKLRQWIKKQKRTQKAVAPEFGITVGGLNDILSGRRLPGRDLAVRIEEQVGIPTRDWVPSSRADAHSCGSSR
jgi:transcriptional regulator with XRE-family HTH domain